MLRMKFVNRGFTLIEVIIVVVILAIVSLIAVPMFSSAAGVQVRTAANMIASDLEYAQSMAITNGSAYSVVFNTAAESYKIVDSEGDVIQNPLRPGSDYVVNFASDSRLSRVNIKTVLFGSASVVQFDYLGSPDNGGEVVLDVDGFEMTVTVEPVTGYVSIQ